MEDYQLKAWKAEVEGAVFMGQPVADMTRDELLALVGYLSTAQRIDWARHEQVRDLLLGANA